MEHRKLRQLEKVCKCIGKIQSASTEIFKDMTLTTLEPCVACVDPKLWRSLKAAVAKLDESMAALGLLKPEDTNG